MHRRPNTLTALLLALLSASIGANPALDGETARLQTQHQELQQQRHDLLEQNARDRQRLQQLLKQIERLRRDNAELDRRLNNESR
ncbi:MAG: hypothetical protein AB2814_03545 [Candidatus Sedimenticola endophacoides]